MNSDRRDRPSATRSSRPTATPAPTCSTTGRTSPSRWHDEFDAWAADVREPVRRPARPDRLPQLGQRPPAGGARGRRRRRRGAVPQHRPAVLRAGQPHRAAADEPRTTTGAGPGCRPTTAGSPTSAPTAPGRRAGVVAGLRQRHRRRRAPRSAGPRSTCTCSAACCCRRSRRTRALPRRSGTRTTSRCGSCARSSTCPSTSTAAAACPTSASTRRPGRSCSSSCRGSPTGRCGTSSSAACSSATRACGSCSPSRASAWLPRGLETLDWFYRRMTLRRRGRGDASSARSPAGMSLTPTRVLPAQLLGRARASCARPRRRCATTSASTGSCGAPTTRTARAATRTRPRRCGPRSAAFDPAEVRAMVETNAAGFYGFDLDALRPIGDRIGPPVDDVRRPLAPERLPDRLHLQRVRRRAGDQVVVTPRRRTRKAARDDRIRYGAKQEQRSREIEATRAEIWSTAVTAVYETDPELIAAVLPPPLEPPDRAAGAADDHDGRDARAARRSAPAGSGCRPATATGVGEYPLFMPMTTEQSVDRRPRHLRRAQEDRRRVGPAGRRRHRRRHRPHGLHRRARSSGTVTETRRARTRRPRATSGSSSRRRPRRRASSTRTRCSSTARRPRRPGSTRASTAS